VGAALGDVVRSGNNPAMPDHPGHSHGKSAGGGQLGPDAGDDAYESFRRQGVRRAHAHLFGGHLAQFIQYGAFDAGTAAVHRKCQRHRTIVA
jgi:hypothetical protein